MAPPAPPPPELNQDITAEILLRVLPEKPGHLSNASLVSKLWHRILSDPGFIRRYRYFHGRAPLLGFIYNLDFPRPNSAVAFDFPALFSRFVATTAASPLRLRHAAHDDDRRVSWALDCRYGRVLFQKADSMGLAVWDPITDDWTNLPPPGIQYASYTAVVLCDVAGCDHRDCRGGRFLVVCIGLGRDVSRTAYACVYSSEDRAWQPPVSDGTTCWRMDKIRPALIGDGVYCTAASGCCILKYDLVEQRFASFSMQNICSFVSLYSNARDPLPVLMQNEDGSLGLAGVRGSRLYLWSRRCNIPEERNEGWVKRKVIRLNKLLPLDINNCIKAYVIGFAEGVGVCFIRTTAGVFTLHLKSRRVTKVSNPSKDYPSVVPFISFFTTDRAS